MLNEKYKAIIKESKEKNIPLAEAAKNKGVKPATFYAAYRRENVKSKSKKRNGNTILFKKTILL